jgi:hypothetical protein
MTPQDLLRRAPRIGAWDAAKTATGWAYITTEGWRTGTLRDLDVYKRHPGREVIAALTAMREAGVETIVCEDCYLPAFNGKKNGATPHTLKELAGTRRAIEMLANAMGLAVLKPVAPARWQGNLLTKGQDSKMEAKRVARLLGAAPANDHEADAVCLAYYAMSMAAAGEQMDLTLRGPRGGKYNANKRRRRGAATRAE